MLLTRKTAILEKLAKASPKASYPSHMTETANSPPDVPNWRKLRARKMSDESLRKNLVLAGGAKTFRGKVYAAVLKDRGAPLQLEKSAAERVGGYKSKLTPEQIRTRIAKIRGTKGYDIKRRQIQKLYSDTFGKDYQETLQHDKRFKHMTREMGTGAGRAYAHSLWAGPALGAVLGARGGQKKQLKALEKATGGN